MNGSTHRDAVLIDYTQVPESRELGGVVVGKGEGVEGLGLA